MGISQSFSECFLASVKLSGANGCDVAKGRRTLMRSGGGKGTEEGGGRGGGSEEASSEHDV